MPNAKPIFSFEPPRLPPVVTEPDAIAVAAWTREEIDALVRHLNEAVALTFIEANREPDRPRQGLVVYADGTNWNPGSGAGLYVYKAGVWAFIA